ncbi:hypothetical protein [Amycolatopsis benzoatilytica]|uniref:hypothetical protein n=1 Tax=Amycolatopsis benzoatilytica TaxID=346045 RepID=UPI0009FD7B08|nr:hypothetical protein [Amycolatopsis benzoatilytica]
MTTVPLTAPTGDETADPGEAVSAEQSATPVGILELSERVAASVLTRFPWLVRASEIMLALFTLVCLVACGTRLSALPLLPIPLFVVSWLFLRQLRDAETSAHRLRWSVLTALAAMGGFWVISVVARWVS